MNQPLQSQQVQFPGYAGAGSVTSAEDRNRVLRNTYWLLALSMLPTVLGAWIGVTTGFTATMGIGMSAIVFLGGAFAFIFAIEKTKNSAAGVPILLAFTFFMGLMLSRLIGVVLGMASLSSIIKRDLSSMGKFLFVGAVMLMVAAIANIFLQSSAMMITISVIAIGIFSAFILYDLKRVQDGLETNYISATLGVYLSIYNVFQSLLAVFGLTSARDE